MIVTIVDTLINMNKIKSEYEESSATSMNQKKMPIYTPSKKPKKSALGKLKRDKKSRSASDWSDSDSSEISGDWESSSECEYETKMKFEQASCEDFGPIVDEDAHELPPLNFDLGGLLNGAFIKTDGNPLPLSTSKENLSSSSSSIYNKDPDFEKPQYPKVTPQKPAYKANFGENRKKSISESDREDNVEEPSGSNRSSEESSEASDQSCRYCIIV